MTRPGLSRRTFAALVIAAPFGAVQHAPAHAAPDAGTNTAPTTADIGENRYQHITAQVFVDEQGPFTFLVDSGANRSAISVDLAARLGLSEGRPLEVNTVLGARRRPTVVLDSLRIGDRSQERIEVPTLALGGDADGILGVDWLKNQRLTFHFAERRLVIETSPDRDAKELSRDGDPPILIPAHLKSGQLSLVDAAVGDRRVAAMIDTGAQFTLGNRALQAWALRRYGASVQSETISIRTVTGERAQGEVMVLPDLRLGRARFSRAPVVFSDVQLFRLWNMEREPALVLGLDLIGLFDRVSLDFGNRRVRLDPPSSPRMAAAGAR